jgi:hypothetical protein
MQKISKEIATSEVNSWLDYKKISEKKRESFRENIDSLISAIEDGVISLSGETKEFTQTLHFPLKDDAGNDTITALKYKARIKVDAVQSQLKNAKSSDAHEMIATYMSVLTGQPKAIIKSLDTEDYSLGNNIAIFFL